MMRLSAEQFYEAMAAVESAGVPRGADRRGGGRLCVLASVEMASYALGQLGPERRVTLNDLAAGGVSVTIDEPVNAGDQFFVRLPSRVGAAFLACGEGSIAEVSRRLPEAA
jgi:hypothetical protein